MSFDRRPPTYKQLTARLIDLLTGDVLPSFGLFDLERWDERIAIVVCDATGMTPERWDKLDYFSREPWIERTIDRLTNEQFTEPPVEVPEETPTPGEESESAVRITWQEVAERLKRLHKKGEPWTSYQKMAEQLDCSKSTIHKAIRDNPQLQRWVTRTTAAPRAQSLNDVISDRTAQSRESNPEDDAAIREHLEREDLTPDVRAFFNSLSREHQLMFLDDPDKHQQIRGRKP